MEGHAARFCAHLVPRDELESMRLAGRLASDRRDEAFMPCWPSIKVEVLCAASALLGMAERTIETHHTSDQLCRSVDERVMAAGRHRENKQVTMEVRRS